MSSKVDDNEEDGAEGRGHLIRLTTQYYATGKLTWLIARFLVGSLSLYMYKNHKLVRLN